MEPAPPISLLRFLWLIIAGSGYIGIAGWLALALVALSAIVVIFRHVQNPECHQKGTAFFGIAHVCLLFFFYTYGVMGFIYATGACSHIPYAVCQTLLVTSVGVAHTLFMSVIVAIVIKRLPEPNVWHCFGLALICLDFFIITGGLLLITIE